MSMILFGAPPAQVRALLKSCFLLLWLESGWERDSLALEATLRNLTMIEPQHGILANETRGHNAYPKDISGLPRAISAHVTSKQSHDLLPLKDYLFLDMEAVKYFLFIKN